MDNTRLAAAAALSCSATVGVAQISLGQTDTFDFGTATWAGSAPTWIGGGGPAGAGDGYMRLDSGGNTGFSNMAAQNTNQWTGNYSAAGVGSISADLKNLGSAELSIRLVLFEFGGSRWVSNNAYTLAGGSGWTHVEFSLEEPGFSYFETGTSVDWAQTLSGVGRLMFRHNPTVAQGGANVTGALGIDNVHAGPVPEPATIAALGAGLLALRRRKRA